MICTNDEMHAVLADCSFYLQEVRRLTQVLERIAAGDIDNPAFAQLARSEAREAIRMTVQL
jgi:hypothetical protein